MRPLPPPNEILRYPVTVGVGALAVLVTSAWHLHYDISPFFMSFELGHGQLWRLFTSALPHVNVLHLVFNLYWLWVFGSIVEDVYGGFRTAAIYAFFVAGSAAA